MRTRWPRSCRPAGSATRSPVADVPDLAALYDWECERVLLRTDQDLAFYRSLLARTGGPVLELACGTGRVTVPLGAVGLDLSMPMVRAAARRGATVLAGDMRSFALHARFPLILVPWNSLQLLDAAGRAACLSCIGAHLAEGGLLGLELIDLEPLVAPLGPVYADDFAALEGELSWVDGTMVYRRRYTTEGTTLEDTITLHAVTDDELAAAGFEVVEREPDGPRRRLALRYAGAPR